MADGDISLVCACHSPSRPSNEPQLQRSERELTKARPGSYSFIGGREPPSNGIAAWGNWKTIAPRGRRLFRKGDERLVLRELLRRVGTQPKEELSWYLVHHAERAQANENRVSEPIPGALSL